MYVLLFPPVGLLHSTGKQRFYLARQSLIVHRKFGKHIQKRQLDLPEYAPSFVDYKALKKLIKKLSATPVIPTLNEQIAQDVGPQDPQKALQANKATFFFRVERELEKVNTFYLQKEAELKLRLTSLLEKKRAMQSRPTDGSKTSSRYIALEEGFRQFTSDLNKLQQFVEINQTAFSKILKKWDKASKSKNKAVFLSCAVDVQPVFNRDVISELSDQATNSLLEFASWAEGEKIPLPSQQVTREQVPDQQDLDIESQIVQAANVENIASLREVLERTLHLPDAVERVSRAFLQASDEAPEAALRLILETRAVNLKLRDEINQRNVLHKATISGRDYLLLWGLEANVDVHEEDVYGRIPLHYACLSGRLGLASALLQTGTDTINYADHDNFTPLIHAIVHSHLAIAQMLLQHDARIDPLTEIDSIPLNLACQYGSIPIVQEILQKQPKILPDAEGLYPQHLVARASGEPDILIMLKNYGADINQPDKLYQWTPLFHAASEGNLRCLQTLLDSGANPDALDEKGLDALYYAVWERHLQCINLLAAVTHVKQQQASISTGTSPLVPSIPQSSTPLAMASDVDSIPPIVLPPPIIPVRRYGHNFLESKTYVVVNFGNLGYDAIQFYDGQKYAAARLTISSKSSDLIPRNLNLPIPDDSKVVSFQIDDLDTFVMDFDVYPTFGAKIICRAVASSKVFTCRISANGHWHLELLDPRLHAIGRLSFNFQVVKPFSGMPLEITHFATYWKATSQLDTHQPSALITGSSLSGDYVRLFVQATSDGSIVLYPQWKVNHHGIEFSLSSISYDQFATVGAGQRTHDHQQGLSTLAQATSADIPEIHRLLASSFMKLTEALELLHPDINIELHVVYPSREEEEGLKLGPTLNINDFADALLTVVFDHARALREKSDGFTRSIVFSSFNADVCTALNWKQPNFPILLCNELGIEAHDAPAGKIESSGRTTLSVKEAVQTAQNNNFMGLICSSRLLGLAPALVDSIKTAGLVLINDVSNGDAMTGQPMSASISSSLGSILPDGIDGTFRANGVLKFNTSVDV